MIKLERIYVKNYKNIAEADLPLGQMNVVVGENNAGKSNLLEVIPLLHHIITGSIEDVRRGFLAGGVFNNFGRIGDRNPFTKHKEDIRIHIDFSDSDSDTVYSYKIVMGEKPTDTKGLFFSLIIAEESLVYKSKSTTGKPNTIFNRKGNKVTYGMGIKKSGLIDHAEDYLSVISILSLVQRSEHVIDDYRNALLALGMVLTSDIFFFSAHLMKDIDSQYENKNRIATFSIADEIGTLQNLPVWKDYQKALENILQIQEVSLLPTGKISTGITTNHAFFVRNNTGSTLYEFSDGTVLLLALITKIYADTSDIFFIEEPENSIHPRALSELMRLIRAKSLDKQFIITTHSPYLLNMIKPEEVFVASINKEGKSEIGKLPNVKAIKKKLAKSFMNTGDIVFSEPDTDEDSE